MPFYGTVLGKQKITLCFASYPSRVGNWGVPQFALPIAWRSWQTVCQNIPWPPRYTLLSVFRSISCTAASVQLSKHTHPRMSADCWVRLMPVQLFGLESLLPFSCAWDVVRAPSAWSQKTACRWMRCVAVREPSWWWKLCNADGARMWKAEVYFDL